MNVYNDGKSFSDVQGTYCRLYDTTTNKEFCRFTLSSCLDKMSNGNIVAELKRQGDKWTMKGMGYYTKETRNSTPMIPIINELMKDIKTNVKILHEGENATEHGWIGRGVTRSECTQKGVTPPPSNTSSQPTEEVKLESTKNSDPRASAKQKAGSSAAYRAALEAA